MQERTENKNKVISNIVLLLISVLIFLALGEILTRIIIGHKLSFQNEESGFYYLKPNQEGWQHVDAVFSEAEINNIGARGDSVDSELVKRSNKYVFLGDSMTFGWLLKDDETMPYTFEKIMNLSDEEVINYASPGYGIDHMTTSYDYHSKYFREGDLFFLVLIDHDFIRPMVPIERGPIKEILYQVKKSSSLLSYLYENLGPTLYKIKSKAGVQPTWGEGNLNETGFEKVFEFNDEVKKNNQKLVVVFYEYNKTVFSENAKNLCEKSNVTCITEIYNFASKVESSEERYAADDGHPSANTNRVVAEGIANFIKENNLTFR